MLVQRIMMTAVREVVQQNILISFMVAGYTKLAPDLLFSRDFYMYASDVFKKKNYQQ